MTTKQKVSDAWLDFKYHFVYIFKVLMFQVALALMICGVLYVLNFRLSISPIVTIISPVPEATFSGKVN